MNLINQIRCEYGQGAVQSYRQWERSSEKLARHRNSLVYSLRCKDEGVTPSFAKLKTNLKTKNAVDIIKSAEKKLLRENIRIQSNKIQRIKQQVTTSKDEFINLVRCDDISKQATEKINRKSEFAHAQSKRTQMKKLEKLCEIRDKSHPSKLDLSGTQLKVWVKNLSKYKLTNDQEKVLAKGLNFAISPDKIPVDEFIVSTEQAFTSLGGVAADRVRFEVAKVLSTKSSPSKTSPRKKNKPSKS